MSSSDSLPLLPPWRIRSWLIAGFFALTFAAYLYPIAGGIFVAWDDTYLIFFNPIIKGISWKTFKAAFSSYDPELYIPLTFLSYQIDYLFGGLSPFVFHFNNLVLHTINALLVTWFLFLFTNGKRWVALLGGLLFAVHPLHTEAVAWASARKDVLSTLFLLISLINYVMYRRVGNQKNYLWSLVTFILGLLSKVTVLMLPLVLILIDWREKRRWNLRMILEKIPYFAFSILFGVIALFGKRDIVEASTMTDKILMAAKSSIFYLQKLFAPFHLSVLYPYNGPISIASPDFYIPLSILLILLLAVFFTIRKTRDIAFGFFFFLLTVIPTFVNFTKGGDLYFASDRYAYAPSIGIFFIVGFVVHSFCTASVHSHIQKARERIALTVSGLVLALFLILTFRQAMTWRDSVALFTNTLRSYPRVMAAHLNLAMVYREMEEYDKSLEQLKIADTIRPHSRTHVAFATLYEREGKRVLAMEEYKKAIAVNPKDPEPYFGLGILYEKDGKIADAVTMYEKVLTIDPKYVGTYNNLGAIYLNEGKLDDARKQYEKAIEIDPYFPDAHFNLALIYEQQNQINDAILEYEKTVTLDPKKSIDALEHLLTLYAKKNDLEKSADTARRIMAINPLHPTAGKFLEALRQRGMIQ